MGTLIGASIFQFDILMLKQSNRANDPTEYDTGGESPVVRKSELTLKGQD